jgi:dihydrofolate synthase / folylpolyglutamate synthase
MPADSAAHASARRTAAVRFLDGRINYERAASMPQSEEAWKLDRMRRFLRRLDNPQDGPAVVHVAGTKGKGSTAAMTAAILSAADYRTGLFTSPHLERLEERIAVDGQPCSADDLADLLQRVRPAVESLDRDAAAGEHGPTYFEILTAMAFEQFRRRQVDAAVLEVGLGGRLDSTNVCTPRVSIITSISLDHTQQLGDTLGQIAAEKAGIIKPGVPVVSGVTDDEPRDVIRRIARQNGCRLIERGVDFDVAYHPPRGLETAASPARFDLRRIVPADGGLFDVSLGLLGRHQAANAALALAAIEQLRATGMAVSESAIRRGLAELIWPARVEVVGRRPTVVLDGAHNAASIAALMETLDESLSASRRLLIFAATQEKDLRGMLRQLLDRFDRVLFTRYADNPRGVPPEELLAQARQWQAAEGRGKAPLVESTATPTEAWSEALGWATPADLICITGSFFLAPQMRREIAARPFPAGKRGRG